MTPTAWAQQNRRTLSLVGGGFLAVLVLNYVVLPAQTPPGALLTALYKGLVTALFASALVLVYRSARIVNFATVAIGGVAATLLFEFTTRGLIPYGLALPIALAAGALVGCLFGLLYVLLFFKHPRLVLTVATIVFTALLVGLQGTVRSWFHKPGDLTDQSKTFFGPLPDILKADIDGLVFRLAHWIGFALMIGALVGLAVFFKKTRFGIAIRGSAENADRASLLGINVKLVAVGVWTIGGLLIGLATSMDLPVSGFSQQTGIDPTELFIPLSAAVLGRMTSLPVTVFSALALRIVQGIIAWSYPESRWFEILVFATVLTALLLQKRQVFTRVRGEASSWAAIREIRPTPRELDRLPQIGITRRALIGIGLGLGLVFPWLTGPGEIIDATNVFQVALAGISLVILTGWAGQISLGQYAFLGVGAVVTGVLSANVGLPFWLVIPIAGIVGALVATAIGIPALRLRGLFLAVTTFGLAVVVPILLFGQGFLGPKLPDKVERPKFLFLNFEDPTSLYYLLLAFLLGTIMMARALRKSRTGRVLIAVREDEQGAQSFGIDITRARLSAFALSGFLAALSGALFVYIQRGGLDIASFDVQASFQIFIMVVVGGLGSVAGGVLGPMFYLLLPNIIQNQVWVTLIQGTAPILVLLFVPGGLTQIVFGMRDAFLRVFATRHHIIVPSLFADYSREAWEHQRIPLAPPMANRGLSALRPEQRYRLTSRLWGRAPQKGTV